MPLAIRLSYLFGWRVGLRTWKRTPEDYRGQFSPISTNVSGIDVCELLPMHAKIADKFTLIRSIAHKFNDHGGGFKHGQHLAFNQELNYPLPNRQARRKLKPCWIQPRGCIFWIWWLQKLL